MILEKQQLQKNLTFARFLINKVNKKQEKNVNYNNNNSNSEHLHGNDV